MLWSCTITRQGLAVVGLFYTRSGPNKLTISKVKKCFVGFVNEVNCLVISPWDASTPLGQSFNGTVVKSLLKLGHRGVITCHRWNTESFWVNIKLHLHLPLFLDMEMVHAIEILPVGTQGTFNPCNGQGCWWPGRTRSCVWSLYWFHRECAFQHYWFPLVKINFIEWYMYQEENPAALGNCILIS